MTSDNEDIPTPPEIKKQLERMRRDPSLRASPIQLKLLEFVVTEALENREISETDILRLLVAPTHPNPEPSNARTTATHLRRTLENEGEFVSPLHQIGRDKAEIAVRR